MKRRLTILALTALAVVALVSVVLTVTSPVHAGGATQISGVGEFSTFTECDDPEGVGADFANRMTGDLVGCLYVFVEAFEDSPSGTYRERGTNLFVGIYNGEFGTFEATYQFTAKFGKDGEIWGRCHHPFVAGSGTGVFDGVTGRFDMQDYIKDGIVVNFPYRGHLLWQGSFEPEQMAYLDEASTQDQPGVGDNNDLTTALCDGNIIIHKK